ncbi:MAG: hypothetical protein JSS54_08670 [Proteobacteria bacterium]|nr:hypothetical protein [Pseudomonadota bacterium]
MDVEDQKFMALEGIHTWSRATIAHATQLSRLSTSFNSSNFIDNRRLFDSERHSFLIAAHRLISFINWVLELNFLDAQIFAEIKVFEPDIKTMRDLNEHVIEYFKGSGKRPQLWSTPTSDASSTVGTKIGDRLDWTEVAGSVAGLIERLPPHYFPVSAA